MSFMDEFKPIFSKDGILSQEFPNFEYRREQEQMATLVQKGLDKNWKVLAEAGTGTGKTLAYTFPISIKLVNEGGRAIIATETKNLQQQLYDKDLPIVSQILKKFTGKEIKFAIAKGKGNYLCMRRLKKYEEKLKNNTVDNTYFKRI